jgi:hypothetical protein
MWLKNTGPGTVCLQTVVIVSHTELHNIYGIKKVDTELPFLEIWSRFVYNQFEWIKDSHHLVISHHNYLLAYLLTPWSTVLLEKLTGFQLVKKFPTYYRTRRFITAFTSARHVPLSWASSIQSMPPHPTSWRSILILSSHLRLGLPSGFFPSGFLTKTLYTPLLSPHTCYMTRPFNSRYDHPKNTALGTQVIQRLGY